MKDSSTNFKHLLHRLHEIIFEADTRACPECMAQGHENDAEFCKFCSARLNPQDE